jgi:hypothetical protein
MAGYTNDKSQAALGLERQGRVGYGIFEAFGKLGMGKMERSTAYRFYFDPNRAVLRLTIQ